MAAASTFTENAIINATLRNITYTPASAGVVYVALFTAAATDLEGGVLTGEITLGSYVRQAAAFSAPVDGASSNSADVPFPVATANYDAEVTQVAIMDALTAGNVLYHGTLTTPKTVTTGDTVKFNAGDLDVSVT